MRPQSYAKKKLSNLGKLGAEEMVFSREEHTFGFQMPGDQSWKHTYR